MIKLFHYIIYLTSLTQPKQALVLAASVDSVYYYDGNQYVRKKIIHHKEESVYTMVDGYVHIGSKYVKIYSFDHKKPELVYKRRRKEPR